MRPVKPLKLARKYMYIFYSGADIDGLRAILAENVTFEGPFFKFDSAEAYLGSLRGDPREGFAYELIHSFEDDSAACLVYRFSKPGVETLMAQMFEVEGDKITKIVLIFDPRAFS